MAKLDPFYDEYQKPVVFEPRHFDRLRISRDVPRQMENWYKTAATVLCEIIVDKIDASPARMFLYNTYSENDYFNEDFEELVSYTLIAADAHSRETDDRIEKSIDSVADSLIMLHGASILARERDIERVLSSKDCDAIYNNEDKWKGVKRKLDGYTRDSDSRSRTSRRDDRDDRDDRRERRFRNDRDDRNDNRSRGGRRFSEDDRRGRDREDKIKDARYSHMVQDDEPSKSSRREGDERVRDRARRDDRESSDRNSEAKQDNNSPMKYPLLVANVVENNPFNPDPIGRLREYANRINSTALSTAIFQPENYGKSIISVNSLGEAVSDCIERLSKYPRFPITGFAGFGYYLVQELLVAHDSENVSKIEKIFTHKPNPSASDIYKECEKLLNSLEETRLSNSSKAELVHILSAINVHMTKKMNDYIRYKLHHPGVSITDISSSNELGDYILKNFGVEIWRNYENFEKNMVLNILGNSLDQSTNSERVNEYTELCTWETDQIDSNLKPVEDPVRVSVMTLNTACAMIAIPLALSDLCISSSSLKAPFYTLKGIPDGKDKFQIPALDNEVMGYLNKISSMCMSPTLGENNTISETIDKYFIATIDHHLIEVMDSGNSPFSVTPRIYNLIY